jgi:hypothetical protein
MSEAYQTSVNPNPYQQFWGAHAPAWGIGAQLGQPQAWGYGLGQAAFGQQNYGGIGGWGQGQGWGNPWQQRQLSQQDVGEIVRQLLPYLPQVVAQAQPQAAFGHGGQGYGAFGPNQGFGGFGPGQRQLSPQDVNEVVRQILPVIPQIVNLLQGQQGPYANAIYGTGIGWHQGNQQGWGQGNNPNLFGQYQQSPFGPLGQAAFGNVGGYGHQRQLNPQDVGEIVRQLAGALPQLIANLQALNQQQQRAA